MIGFAPSFYTEARSLYRLWLIECRRQKVLRRVEAVHNWIRANMDDEPIDDKVFAVSDLFSEVAEARVMKLSEAEKRLDGIYALIGDDISRTKEKAAARKIEELSCSFCGKTDRDTACLIKRDDLHICRECVLRCIGLMTGKGLAKETAVACSFCHREWSEVRVMTSIYPGVKDRICDECAVACLEIIIGNTFGQRKVSDVTFRTLDGTLMAKPD